MLTEILCVCAKEMKVDMRNLSTVGSVLLFLIGSTLISQKCFVTIHGVGWVALFWILYLFSIINMALQAFQSGRSSSRLAQYTYHDGVAYAIGKWLYQFGLNMCLALVLLGVMTVFFGNPIDDLGLFGLGVLLATIGLCTILSFVSFLTASVENSHMLSTVLAMPITLPFLLLGVKVSVVSLGLISDTSIGSDLVLMLAIALFSVGISLVLLPTLWKA